MEQRRLIPWIIRLDARQPLRVLDVDTIRRLCPYFIPHQPDDTDRIWLRVSANRCIVGVALAVVPKTRLAILPLPREAEIEFEDAKTAGILVRRRIAKRFLVIASPDCGTRSICNKPGCVQVIRMKPPRVTRGLSLRRPLSSTELPVANSDLRKRR